MAEQRRTYRVSGTSVDELNFILAQLSDRLDQMEGYRGIPTFQSDIDLNSKRATNAGQAVGSDDLVPKGQMDDLKAEILDAVFPVGMIISLYVDTDPSDLFGVGTWELWGAGKVPVCLDSADSDFSAVAQTGGAKTHLHTVDPPSTTSGVPSATMTAGAGAVAIPSDTHTHDVDIVSFNSGTESNLMPYIVEYRWRRIS